LAYRGLRGANVPLEDEARQRMEDVRRDAVAWIDEVERAMRDELAAL
jgi:hypothetical protein